MTEVITAVPTIPIKVVSERPEWIPVYQSEGASGADFLAAIDDEMIIEPGKVVVVPTGLRLEIPEGFEVQIRPRSGLAMKHGITVLNGPGTVDSDYRGEVSVILMNHGDKPFVVFPGMRIAQMVVAQTVRAQLLPVPMLSKTQRGAGGFGHTGA